MRNADKNALKVGLGMLSVLVACAATAWISRGCAEVPPAVGVFKAPPDVTVNITVKTPTPPAPTYPLMGATPDELADAIFWSEGGFKTRYYYGIMNGTYYPTAEKARPVCLKTITNSYARWLAAEQPVPFIEFLGNRYCPESVDPIGYRNWLVNVRWFLKNPRPVPTP